MSLQRKVTIGLQTGLILTGVGLLHTLAGVLGELGLLSDLFLFIGAIQTARFLLNEDVRYDVAEIFVDALNVNDISKDVVELAGKLAVDTVKPSDIPSELELNEEEEIAF